MPTKAELSSRKKAGTSSQKLMLFRRGKAMSGAPIISGTNQLPKPPISAGITTKNTMIRPWAEMMTFQSWPSVTNWLPGLCSSIRMMTENRPPIRPAMIEKMI